MDQDEATRVTTELFESWGPFLLRYAVRTTRSFEFADDLVQEAFLALYRDLRCGKRIDNTKAWTFGAVRNQVRKHARYVRRHNEELDFPEELDRLPARPSYPDVAAEFEDQAPLGLSLLSVREEEVLLLRLQSFKYREIAGKLGIGTKSVCTLLARALKKLRIAAGTPLGATPRGRRSHDEVRDALQ
jgi:RNA polymerase sigma-70 factor, ECF subfamily